LSSHDHQESELRRRLITRAATAVSLPVLAGLLALIGSPQASASARTQKTTSEAKIPAGLVLRVGDQGQDLETLFSASGVLKGAPYKVQFDQFGSGPLVDAAFAAHQIDLGTMGDTPAAATVSSHLGVRAVAVAKWDGPVLVLLAKPGITSVSQLKGKNVAYTTGTAEQAFALRALAAAHLKQSQVKQVNVSLQELGTVLETGAADASTVAAPDEFTYKQSHPGAKVLAATNTVTPAVYDYVLASSQALSSPGTSAAAFDFVHRLIEAQNWVKAHPNQWVQDYYVNVNHETPAVAKELLDSSGEVTYVPISGAVTSALQQMVTLMAQAGAIDASYNTSPLFQSSATTKYNALVKETPQK
jgi:sulfonate transport system substrate-binding protein